MQPAATTQGCYRGWCSDTAFGRLCACVRENTDDIQFTLERSRGKEVWKAAFIPPFGGEAAHFRLDRIGEQALLLAVLRSESVGIAVSDWSVWAIDREKVSAPLEVQNYGTFSFATKPATGACLLLAARWHTGWEPGRGHGMYVAGSWYAIEGGSFERVEDRPAIYRRYLSGLERARHDAEERDQPLTWFRAAAPAIGPRPVTGKQP